MKLFDCLVCLFISLLGFTWWQGKELEWLWGLGLIFYMICTLIKVYKYEKDRKIVDPRYVEKVFNDLSKKHNEDITSIRVQLLKNLNYMQILNEQQIKINSDNAQVKDLVMTIIEAIESTSDLSQNDLEYKLSSETENASDVKIDINNDTEKGTNTNNEKL